VPPSFDKAQLADALRHHPTLLCPNATTGRDGRDRGNDVQVDTLAPDLEPLEQVATVRFLTLPSPLQTLGSKCQLTIDIPVAPDDPPVGAKRKRSSSQAVRLTIDDHFYGTTVLHSPSDHDIDVLAVSGLGSHAFGSFVHKQDGHMWLRDRLPQHAPTARVILYGYESGLQRGTSFAHLGDLASSLRITMKRLLQSAKRRLVLIGHSLGGLLVKEALVQIAESDSGSSLTGLISGILFFGVPNDGIDMASLIPMVNDQPNRFLLESLNAMNSQILDRQKRDFSTVVTRASFDIFCFFETELSPTAAKVSMI